MRRLPAKYNSSLETVMERDFSAELEKELDKENICGDRTEALSKLEAIARNLKQALAEKTSTYYSVFFLHTEAVLFCCSPFSFAYPSSFSSSSLR